MPQIRGAVLGFQPMRVGKSFFNKTLMKGWVLVNYSVKSKNETFFVSEHEEKHRKKKNKYKKVTKMLLPVLTVIFNLSKFL